MHLQAAQSDHPAREPARVGMPSRPSADFETFYREHIRFVWRSVRRLGIDPMHIDDIVQETFLVVHRKLAAFEGRSAVKTWLYGIVRRVIADHRRSLRRKPAFADGGAADERADAAGVGPDVSAEQAEQVRLLYRVLGQLDDEKREVFILAELEGMTLAEIAEALDANANTIASRLRAARQKFEDALERETADGRGSTE